MWVNHVLRAVFTFRWDLVDYRSGLRIGLAVAGPMIVADWMGPGHVHSMMGIIALFAALSDDGGTYTRRAINTVVATVTCSVAAFSGWLTADTLVVGGLLMFFWAWIGGMFLAVTGHMLGCLVPIVFAIALDTGARPLGEAFGMTLGCLAAGAFASGLSVVLFPFRYRIPARRAVAKVYDQLARAHDVSSALVAAGFPGDQGKELSARRLDTRQALDIAARTTAEQRIARGRFGSRDRALVLLTAHAERLFVDSVAETEAIRSLRWPSAKTRESLAGFEVRLARACREISRAAAHGSQTEVTEALERSVESLSTQLAVVEDALSEHPGRVSDDLRGHVAVLVETVRRAAADLSGEVVSSDGARSDPTPDSPEPEPHHVWAALRKNMFWRSLVLRHGLRVGVATAATLVIGRALGVPQLAWVTLTILVIMRPVIASTLSRTVQRVIGTVVGTAIAAIVVTYFAPGSAVLVGLAFACAVVIALLTPVNYMFFASAIAIFVLFLLGTTFPGDLSYAGFRIANTAVGAVIAVIATFVLWPNRSIRQMPEMLADMLTSVARYIHGAAQGEPLRTLQQLRRDMWRCDENLQAGMQRLLQEPFNRALAAESYLPLVSLTERTMSDAWTLAVLETRVRPDARESLAELTRLVEARLEILADAIRELTPPPPSDELQAALELRAPVPSAPKATEDSDDSVGQRKIFDIVGDVIAMDVPLAAIVERRKRRDRQDGRDRRDRRTA
jgi:uncharacterized membrane protein YccC